MKKYETDYNYAWNQYKNTPFAKSERKYYVIGVVIIALFTIMKLI